VSRHIEYQEYDGCHNCEHLWWKGKEQNIEKTLYFCDADKERPNDGTYSDCAESFNDPRFPYEPSSGTSVHMDWMSERDKYVRSQLELFQSWAEKNVVNLYGICPRWK
jgi:hypothetical protein